MKSTNSTALLARLLIASWFFAANATANDFFWDDGTVMSGTTGDGSTAYTGGSFSFSGFAESTPVWTKLVGTRTWTFSEATDTQSLAVQSGHDFWLAAGSWSGKGVTEQILSDNGTVQVVCTSVATGTLWRFLRLKVMI